jgi:hypothetical protein
MQAKNEIAGASKVSRLQELKNRLYEDFFEVAEEIGRLEAVLEFERRVLFESAQQRSKKTTVNQKTAAAIMHVSSSALSRGAKHVQCANRARINNGGKVEYPVDVCERHWANMVSRSKCGDCDKPIEPPLRILK